MQYIGDHVYQTMIVKFSLGVNAIALYEKLTLLLSVATYTRSNYDQAAHPAAIANLSWHFKEEANKYSADFFGLFP